MNQVYNDDLGIELRLVDETDDLNFDTEAKATGANGPCGAHPCFDAATADSEAQLRSCDVPALGRNRTVLGQNLISEFVVARFGRSGKIDEMLEIE